MFNKTLKLCNWPEKVHCEGKALTFNLVNITFLCIREAYEVILGADQKDRGPLGQEYG